MRTTLEPYVASTRQSKYRFQAPASSARIATNANSSSARVSTALRQSCRKQDGSRGSQAMKSAWQCWQATRCFAWSASMWSRLPQVGQLWVKYAGMSYFLVRFSASRSDNAFGTNESEVESSSEKRASQLERRP